MKRKVVSVRNFIDSHARGTRGTNILTLECGHEKGQKGSVKVTEYTFCSECADWANGYVTYKQMGNVVETWDTRKQMPIFTKKKPTKGQLRVLTEMAKGMKLFQNIGTKSVYEVNRFMSHDYYKLRWDTFIALRDNGWIDYLDNIPEGEVPFQNRQYFTVSESGKEHLG